MATDDLHLTKSHLLRRLLQRRVELLETEKNELKSQIHDLEARLAEANLSGSTTARSLREVVEETMDSVRSISDRAETEALFTLKVAHHEQEKLVAEMANLRNESNRLARLMLDATEGFRSIREQAQCFAAFKIKEAQLQQEQLTAEMEAFLQGSHGARPSIAEARQQVFVLQDRAQELANRFEGEVQEERERLMDQISELREEIQLLQGVIQEAIERSHKLSERSHAETARAMRVPNTPMPQAKRPALAPAKPKVEASVPEREEPSELEAEPQAAPTLEALASMVTNSLNEEAVLKVARAAILGTPLIPEDEGSTANGNGSRPASNGQKKSTYRSTRKKAPARGRRTRSSAIAPTSAAPLALQVKSRAARWMTIVALSFLVTLFVVTAVIVAGSLPEILLVMG